MKRWVRLKRLALVLFVAFVVAGCSIRGAMRPDTYTVRRGDTLSHIAASYGMDWRDLARWNNIRAPYLIEVGQRLSLDPYPPLDYPRSNAPPRSRPVAAPPARRQPQVARAPQDSRAAQEAAIQASTPQLKRTIERASPQQQPPARPTPAAPPQVAADEDVASEAEITEASQQAPIRPTRTGGPSEDGWQWPASGSIIRGYAAQRTRQGIDIGGREGSPVYAASSGRVVYNGTGLKGYGKLLIIKHDEKYLSAYGFTRNTRVAQGQDVAAGMHIADMGLGPQNKPMLHFEIRRNGRPIDPASLLPNAD